MKSLLMAIAGASLLAAQSGSPAREVEADVLKAEDSFRVAKLKNDVSALDRMFAAEYVGVNQYGVIRDKAEALELWKAFKLTSLTPVQAVVKISGDVAIVMGAFTEVNPGGTEKLMFTRVWQRRDGRWQMLASTQLLPQN